MSAAKAANIAMKVAVRPPMTRDGCSNASMV
jgi:hypothetical protein